MFFPTQPPPTYRYPITRPNIHKRHLRRKPFQPHLKNIESEDEEDTVPYAYTTRWTPSRPGYVSWQAGYIDLCSLPPLLEGAMVQALEVVYGSKYSVKVVWGWWGCWWCWGFWAGMMDMGSVL